MDLAGILTGVFGGGATGLVGSAITAFSNYKLKKLDLEEKKEDRAHEIAMAQKDMEFMKAESEARLKIQKTKTEAELAVADTNAYIESVRASAKPDFHESYMKLLMKGNWLSKYVGTFIAFLMGVVDFLKSAARPMLTYYLMFVTTWVTFTAYGMLNKFIIPVSNPDAVSAGVVQVMTVNQAYDIFDKVLVMILYLTTSSVSWWFADRRIGKSMESIFNKKS